MCGEHGDTISLVMKSNGMGFREAAEWLGASPQPSPKGKGDGFREEPEHQLERKNGNYKPLTSNPFDA